MVVAIPPDSTHAAYTKNQGSFLPNTFGVVILFTSASNASGVIVFA